MGGHGGKSKYSGFMGSGGGAAGFGGGGGMSGTAGGGAGGAVGGAGAGAGTGGGGAGGGAGGAPGATGTGTGGSLGSVRVPNLTMGTDPNFAGFTLFSGDNYNADLHHEAVNFDINRWNALTPEQRSGIYDYTDSYYRQMNKYLRFGIPAYDQNANLQRIQNCTEGIKAYGNLQEDCVLWRGSSRGIVASMFGVDEAKMSDASYLQSRLGSVITDKGILSSAVDEAAAWGADVKIKIYAHKGVNAFYVEPISANKFEFEVLWNRDSSFKLHSFKTNVHGEVSEMVIESV